MTHLLTVSSWRNLQVASASSAAAGRRVSRVVRRARSSRGGTAGSVLAAAAGCGFGRRVSVRAGAAGWIDDGEREEADPDVADPCEHAVQLGLVGDVDR